MRIRCLPPLSLLLVVGSVSAQEASPWPPVPVLESLSPADPGKGLPATVLLIESHGPRKLVEFHFDPQAVGCDRVSAVHLAGTFNGWNAETLAMHQVGGGWQLRLELEDGVHLYKFVVDGQQWFADPGNPRSVDDQHGGRNSELRLGLAARLQQSTGRLGDGRIEVAAFAHDPVSVADLQQVGDSWLIRARTLVDDVEQLDLFLSDGRRLPMTPVLAGPVLQHWERLLDPSPPGTAYAFVAHDGATHGRFPPLYQMPKTPPSIVHTPDWAKDAIWYQIMLDRFRNGDPTNDPKPVRPWTSDWYQSSDFEGRDGQSFWKWFVFRRHYGGDLAGLEQQLDYLEALGVNALYLNPVFEAPSHHKYDATDYRHIDQHLGAGHDYTPEVANEDLNDPTSWSWTASDELFLKVLHAAKARGFRVILDGVWNHVGVQHPAFQDVQRRGPRSPYADWFAVDSWQPFRYQGWAGFGELPIFAKNERGLASEAVKQHIFAVTRRWMDPDGDGDPADGIDGWRLDVPNEIAMPFWHEWCALVRSINPDAYLSGEIWHRADEWLDGRTFDAVMNYPFAAATLGWIGNREQRLTPSEVDHRLAELRLAYPPEVTAVMMNLLDSHDTDRLVSRMLNPDRSFDGGNREQDPGSTYDNSKPGRLEYRKAQLAVLLQMTYVGAPMIYYGSEMGMWGPDDPSNRKPMLWPDLEPYDNPEDRVDREHLAFYHKVVALRRAHPALRRGSFRSLVTDDVHHLWVFERRTPAQRIVVALNASDSPRSWQPGAQPSDRVLLWGEPGPIPPWAGKVWEVRNESGVAPGF